MPEDDIAVIHTLVRDEGSVVVFAATVPFTGDEIVLAVDHRCAQDIVDALQTEDPLVNYEPWQVIG